MEKYPCRMITDINLVLADVVKPSAAGMSWTLYGLLAALDLNYSINGCLTLYLIIRSFWSEKMELGSDAKNFNVIF